jgi:hypothetical protein
MMLRGLETRLKQLERRGGKQEAETVILIGVEKDCKGIWGGDLYMARHDDEAYDDFIRRVVSENSCGPVFVATGDGMRKRG